MRCDACKIDKTVIVTTTIKIPRMDLRMGRESTEVRTTRLCRSCGGAENGGQG